LRDELDKQGAKYEVNPMPNCADVQIGKILIQRKEINDFYGSILDRRIWEQAKSLVEYKKEGIRPVFVIEDKKLFGKNQKRKQIILKAVEKSLVFSFGVPVWKTKDIEDTIKLLISLDSKDDKPFSLNPKPKFKSEDEQLQYFLEGIQGIGPITAQRILANHKTEILEVFHRILALKNWKKKEKMKWVTIGQLL
jgi:ERCC4-type nuclease